MRQFMYPIPAQFESGKYQMKSAYNEMQRAKDNQYEKCYLFQIRIDFSALAVIMSIAACGRSAPVATEYQSPQARLSCT